MPRDVRVLESISYQWKHAPLRFSDCVQWGGRGSCAWADISSSTLHSAWGVLPSCAPRKFDVMLFFLFHCNPKLWWLKGDLRLILSPALFVIWMMKPWDICFSPGNIPLEIGLILNFTFPSFASDVLTFMSNLDDSFSNNIILWNGKYRIHCGKWRGSKSSFPHL